MSRSYFYPGKRMTKIEDQKPPEKNDSRPIWELVIEDMQERDKVGRERYGTPLQAHNGRDSLIDAYQEALDLVVYLRQAIEERSAAKAPFLGKVYSCVECGQHFTLSEEKPVPGYKGETVTWCPECRE